MTHPVEYFHKHISKVFNRDGAERSGFLCVVSVVLERLKVEQDVAIGHVIEELRSCREQIIPTLVRIWLSELLLKNFSLFSFFFLVTMENRPLDQ